MVSGISPLIRLFCEREVGEGEINILGFLHRLFFLPLFFVAEEGEVSKFP